MTTAKQMIHITAFFAVVFMLTLQFLGCTTSIYSKTPAPYAQSTAFKLEYELTQAGY